MSTGPSDDYWVPTPRKVPKTWQQLDFSDALETVPVGKNKLPQKEYQQSGDLPVIDQGQDFIGGYTDNSDLKIEPGDGLLVFGDHTRAVKLIKFPFAAGADGIKILRPLVCGAEYAHYALRSIPLPNRGYSRHFGYLKKTKFPVAPEAEQSEIVSKIDELFSQIDKGERALKRVQTLVERYRQSVLKAAVTGELTRDWRALQKNPSAENGEALLQRILMARRAAWEKAELEKMATKGKTPANDAWKDKYKKPPILPDVDALPDLPDGWTWASMGQAGEVTGGLTKNSKRSSLALKKPYLRVANVYQNRLELDNVHEIGVRESEIGRVALQPNDLLIVEGNGSIGQIGRVALWDASVPECVHQNHLIKVRFKNAAFAQFALVWCLSPSGRRAIERVASSTAGLHTLSISKVQQLPIPIPPEGELATIWDGVERMKSDVDFQLKEVGNNIDRAVTLRQAVLKSAFSGRLIQYESCGTSRAPHTTSAGDNIRESAQS